ncbi:MAG: WD40 repeat domain-containing protein [Candidatus Kapabacteria bacterium]|nr:WD40 repeat domain-containing protein [Candidatus Kapabacteria bacterium]
MHIYSLLRTIIVSVGFLLLCTVSGFAQLTLSFSGGNTLNGSAYPKLTARVKATLNKSPFALSTSSVIIIEDVLTSVPVSVSPPEGDGTQTITWYTRNRTSEGVSATLVAFNGNYTASISTSQATGLAKGNPQMRFRDGRAVRINEYYCGNVSAGRDSVQFVQCFAITGRISKDGNELPVVVDSIATQTPFFKAVWKGGNGTYKLPGYAYSPLGYPIEITFSPKENKYYSDVLTVYYEGGAVERIKLYGNIFELPAKTILNVTYPNGGEQFAPCQQTTITWTGTTTGGESIVEYSTDNGAKWELITVTADSTCKWTVPDIPASSMKIRVSQVNTNTQELQLSGTNRTSVDKFAFSPDGKRILGAYRNGEIIEWDVENGAQLYKWGIRTDTLNKSNATAFGINYTSASSFFVAYRSTYSKAVADTLAFFTGNSKLPTATIALDSTTRYKAALYDSSGTFIALIPQLGTTIALHSTADGSLLQTIQAPSVITSVGLGKYKAVATLMDGRIIVYSLPDWTIQSYVSIPGLPLIEQCILLPDNNNIAVGCRVSAGSLTEGSFSEQHIINISTQEVIRSQRKASSTPIGVTTNATSRYVVFGYTGQPQAPLWDISPNQVYGALTSHQGALTDLKFSNDGLTVGSSANSPDNLKVKKFIFPESDISDAEFTIVRPTIQITKAVMKPTYAFTQSDTVFTLSFCNKGILPVPLGGDWLNGNTSFRISGATIPDTLQPGECLSIPISFNPLDTGTIKDIFNTFTCNTTYNVPIEGYSIPRSLTVPDTIDVGDICIGQSIEKDLVVLRNNDPAMLVVDQTSIYAPSNRWFSTTTPIANDTLQQNGEVKMHIVFTPRDLGVALNELYIYYGGQRKIYSKVILRGRGSGAETEATANPLTFIPEQTTRTIYIRNKNNNPITLTSLGITPANGFTMQNITTPRVINANDSLPVTITWNNTDSTSAQIVGTLEPCATPLSIPIRLYTATGTVYIERVEADPKGNATIPVKFNTKEQFSYNGIRTFTSQIFINPRIFLPQEVTSQYGTGKLLRNEIVGDKRLIEFSVEGNFPNQGTVANITGVAGLAETDVSPIEFNKQSLFWSKATTVTTTDGTFQLINLCGDRRVQQLAQLALERITPNPVANGNAELTVYSDSTRDVLCTIVTSTGEVALQQPLHLTSGSSTQILTIAQLPSGTYTLNLRSPDATVSSLLVVVR